jgi:ABC-type uncharacterized transport system permease subunit
VILKFDKEPSYSLILKVMERGIAGVKSDCSLLHEMPYTRLPAALIPYFIESLVMVVCVVQSFLQMLEYMHTRLQHFRF